MKMRIMIRSKVKMGMSFWMPLIVFIVVYCSSDTVLFGTNGNVSMQKTGQMADVALIAILPVFSLLFNKSFSLTKRQAGYAVLMFAGILASSIINFDLRGGVFFKLALVILCMEMAVLLPFKDFCLYLERMIVFFAWCSVVFYFVFQAFPFAASIGIPLINSADWPFRHFGVYVQEDLPPIYLRNYGIFREPGVYQMFLIISMIVIVCCKDWKKKSTIFSMTGLVLALWLTKSTTAYFAFVVFVFYALSYKGYFNRIGKARKLVVIAAIALAALLCMLPLIYDDIIQWADIFTRKFDKSYSSYYSFYARYSSITVNIMLWLKNPLFGIGLTDHDGYFEQTAIKLYGLPNNCNTNTILAQFGAFGIVMGVVWIIAVCRASGMLGRNKTQKILVFVLLMMLFMCENVTFSPVWNMLMFYAVSYKRGYEAGECETAWSGRNSLDEKSYSLY